MSQVTLKYTAMSVGDPRGLALHGAATPEAGAFRAQIAQPTLFRDCLVALGGIARATFEQLPFEQWIQTIYDPLVGIHPDGVSFEAFSHDGSTHGWVHFDSSVFGEPEIRRPGCTSIDYSDALDEYLKRISFTSKIQLSIGSAEGVAMESATGGHIEKKISMPDEWVHGFGELHAGLLQARHRLELTRADLLQILRHLKSRKDVRKAKRALIFRLTPGERPKAILQPWDITIPLQGEPADVDEEIEIKVYGRRRLFLIEALLPQIEKLTVYLVDDARPSYWEMQIGAARFTLAMSAWTNRTFTKTLGESLLAARAAVDDAALARAAAMLADAEMMSFTELGAAMEIGAEAARGVALALCRQGLAVADPHLPGVRWRPATFLPFAEVSARGVASGREDRAAELLVEGKLEVESVREAEGLIVANGRCEGRAGEYAVSLALNADGSFASGDCECAWVKRNGLKSGPCKHLLALRERALTEIGNPKQRESHHG